MALKAHVDPRSYSGLAATMAITYTCPNPGCKKKKKKKKTWNITPYTR
jgi:hypothetical protein